MSHTSQNHDMHNSIQDEVSLARYAYGNNIDQ